MTDISNSVETTEKQLRNIFLAISLGAAALTTYLFTPAGEIVNKLINPETRSHFLSEELKLDLLLGHPQKEMIDEMYSSFRGFSDNEGEIFYRRTDEGEDITFIDEYDGDCLLIRDGNGILSGLKYEDIGCNGTVNRKNDSPGEETDSVLLNISEYGDIQEDYNESLEDLMDALENPPQHVETAEILRGIINYADLDEGDYDARRFSLIFDEGNRAIEVRYRRETDECMVVVYNGPDDIGERFIDELCDGVVEQHFVAEGFEEVGFLSQDEKVRVQEQYDQVVGQLKAELEDRVSTQEYNSDVLQDIFHSFEPYKIDQIAGGDRVFYGVTEEGEHMTLGITNDFGYCLLITHGDGYMSGINHEDHGCDGTVEHVNQEIGQAPFPIDTLSTDEQRNMQERYNQGLETFYELIKGE